jgi:hypothetical protein
MSYCLHCNANQFTDSVQRKVEQQTFVQTGEDGQGYYRDDSYWVTDYYCQVCKSYIDFPRATNPREYNEARSLSISMWLWVPVYIGLAIVCHTYFAAQFVQNISGWVNLITYLAVILLPPWVCCWCLHKLLPKFFYENIALLIRSVFITALEASLLLIPIVILGMNLQWTYGFKVAAFIIEGFFILVRCRVRFIEIINENRLRNRLNRLSK